VRFTIERMRTLVLAAGVLLLVALAVFLVVGRWKKPLNLKDMPKRLGINIVQEANGVTYSQAMGAHSQFKIHASNVVELKQGNHLLLHDVKIELYGEDGSRVDRIEGKEFEYDQESGLARATGPVELTLMRPSIAPAIAPKATPEHVVSGKSKGNPLTSAAALAAAGQIHVKTSGLTFDQKSGIASTSQRVDFSMAKGSGNSMGASFDSQKGFVVLDHAVELKTVRGNDMVEIQARHGEFQRDELTCHLLAATASYRGGQVSAVETKVLFREDGSAAQLNATGGFTLVSATGSRISAPSGSLVFDEHNQPRHGHLEGGVRMDSASDGRQLHGASPTADLEFTTRGVLRHAHLERGVEMHSEEQSQTASNAQRLLRNWHSQLADVEFRDAGHGQVEPSTVHGSGGVVVTSQSQRGKALPASSRLAADEVTGTFGHGSVLTAMTGMGHARIEETTISGTRQSSSGDRLEARFASIGAAKANAKPKTRSEQSSAAQIQSSVLTGHVVLIQQPAAKPGAPSEAPMRATAGRAVYEGVGEWLHLTISPRVQNGSLQLTADKIDVSRESGDAFAHGSVKATWIDTGSARNSQLSKPAANSSTGQNSMALGGQGPVHVIASDAQLHTASSEATFRGHARLWQQANSIAGPLIVLDRQNQTLVARSSDPSEPVRAALLSAAEPASGKISRGNAAAPSVIRLRGGDLKYSDVQRKVVMLGKALGQVVAETGSATSASNQVELLLLPPGSHPGKNGGQGQVDRMTATGHVVVSSQGRRGIGEQLTYSSETGEYVLTGTAAVPPRMSDPARGTVTGAALIFHSRGDSVSIEGGGHETRTETTSPR